MNEITKLKIARWACWFMVVFFVFTPLNPDDTFILTTAVIGAVIAFIFGFCLGMVEADHKEP